MSYNPPPPKSYRCETKDNNSCPYLCCLLLEVKPMPGKIHHPEIPFPNPVKKITGDELDVEIQRKLRKRSNE